MQAHRALASSVVVLGLISFNVLQAAPPAKPADKHADHQHTHIHFDVKSVADGNWSDATTWAPSRVPKAGDRVLVSRETRVTYDVENKAVLRMVQVVGTLTFARDRNTEINVGLLFGFGQFISTFVITILYVRWADREFDPRAQALHDRLEEGQR